MKKSLGVGLIVLGVAAGCSNAPDTDDKGDKAARDGITKTVSVASIALPKGKPWTESPAQQSDSIDEAYFATGQDAEKVPSCSASLSVQSGYRNGAAAVRQQATAEGADSITIDSEAPKDVEGLIIRHSGPKEATAEQRPFTSTVRTWVTKGGTLITATEVIAKNDTACTKDAIIGSLSWSGKER